MTRQVSTRMGTALRHAGHFLRFRRVARKLILLVTDCKPHDIDVHDIASIWCSTPSARWRSRRASESPRSA
jgi:nitric oxide reductase activation protein